MGCGRAMGMEFMRLLICVGKQQQQQQQPHINNYVKMAHYDLPFRCIFVRYKKWILLI